MRKILLTILLVLPFAGMLRAQSLTSVTGIVEDSAANIYANCSYNVNLDMTGVTSGLLNPGIQTSFAGAKCDASGNMSIALYDTSTLSVTGAKWRFSFCGSDGTHCFNFTIPITGASQNITSNIQTVAPAISTGLGALTASSASISGSATIAGPSPFIDITAAAYGAKGDAKIVADAVTTVSSTTITSATAAFVAGDVGKQFSATPTAYSTTGQLTGTISAVNSATSITVSITSGTATSSSGVRLIWGTDNTSAIQSAITTAQGLCKGGDGSSNSGLVPFDSGCPVVFIPPPSTGIGYVISGAVNTTHEGMAVTTLGRESAALYLNAPAANFNFSAPSGTYHGWYLHGIAFECSYVANTGLTLDSIEESHIENIRVNNCMTQGIKLTNTTGTNGLTTFVDLREAGNVVGILNNSSQQTVFYHCNIYGSSNNSNTLVGVKFTGSHVINEFNGCWMEGLQTALQVDNTGGTNVTVFSFRDGRVLSTVTGFHFISASSQNVNNLLLLNAIVDGNEFQTTASTNWNDLLMNGNVAASGINVRWTNNIRDSGPSNKVFNTDSSLTHIIYNNNNGVNGSNIITGAGALAGFDCGAEFQLGPLCQIRNNSVVLALPTAADTLAGLLTFASPPALGSTTPAAVNATTLTTTGLATKYNNISTVGNGLGSVLAQSDLTAQAAALGPTTIYAVPASGAGEYQVCFNAKVTQAATTSSTLGGVGGFQLIYTDKDDSVVVTTAGGLAHNTTTANLSGNTTQQGETACFLVNAKASTNIQYQYGYTSSGATPMQFNFHIKVMAL